MAVEGGRAPRHAVGLALIALVALNVLGCAVEVMTPVPAGYPLNPCPLAGPGSVTPREGNRLIPPGEIAFAYTTWHNETPDTFACGAQSITGGKAIITPADFPSGILPWVATYRRAVPLQAAEQVGAQARLFSITPTGANLVETTDLGVAAPQFGALGNCFDQFQEPTPGLYRLQIFSATGELLATGEFELRP